MSLKSKILNRLLLTALLGCVGLVHAQAPSSAPATTAISPAKKELIGKLVQLQQPGIDAMSRGLLQQPIERLMQGVGAAVQQNVPEDKRQATLKSVESEVQKFYNDTGAMLSERAQKLAPATLTPILDERFSEDELRQLIAWMESPINKRYFELGSQMQKSLAEKLVADTRPAVETRLKALEQNVVKTLNAAQGQAAAKPAAAASGSKPAPAAGTKK